MTAEGLRYRDLPIARIREATRLATTRFLGVAIGIGDDDWQEPSLLPGWTRAHVASHLARSAEAMTALVAATMDGSHPELYPTGAEVNDEAIERGSERTGLELQIDLDTTAVELYRQFEEVIPESAWATGMGTMPGLDLRDLAVARISELELHKVDLALGHTLDEIDDDVAHWLLELQAKRRRNETGYPPVWLETTLGERYQLNDEPRAAVRGTAQGLLGWLTGREAATVETPDGIDRPQGGAVRSWHS